jgi:TIR domain
MQGAHPSQGPADVTCDEMTTPTLSSHLDAFISHASEDKESFVRPLAHALTALGASVWYDEFSLKLGDSLTASIDKGLATSRYGIVVLSKAFIAKPWPQRELQGLVAREMGGRSTILPVWHNLTIQEVLDFSPPLADKLAANTTGKTADQIALQILSVIRPDIAGNIPYDDLRKIATGEAVAELRNEIDRIRGDLKEFQCPHCASRLLGSQPVPLDLEEKHWGMLRSFECGFTDKEGEVTRPCPSDPDFPTLDDYDIKCGEEMFQENPLFRRWSCEAFPKTAMARRLRLPPAYGNTKETARLQLQSDYEKRAHPGGRPMRVGSFGFIDLDGDFSLPHPSDPDFPTLDDYDIKCGEEMSQENPLFRRWSCEAFPKTGMAHRLRLPPAYGNTKEAARLQLQNEYGELVHRMMRP